MKHSSASSNQARKNTILIRPLKRRTCLALLGLPAALCLIMCWNYFGQTSMQLQVEKTHAPKLDHSGLYQNLQAAIQIPSISTPLSRLDAGSNLHQFREFLATRFPALHAQPFVVRTGADFEDELIPSVLLEWPGQQSQLPGILLMSHFDVVPVEPSTLSDWQHSPFSGHIDGEYLWGRGTLDCKHGVMAILEALSKLHADGFQPQRTIYVALGHDEELGGHDGNRKMAEWLRRHGRRLQVVMDEGGCVYTEFPGMQKPTALVGVAEKGYLNVELEVLVDATLVGHASMPPNETAVSILASALHQVQLAPFPARVEGGLRKTLRYLGPEMPLPGRLAIANLWLTKPLIQRRLALQPSSNALLRTTIASTVIEGGVEANILPHRARATLNLRLLPGDSMASALEHIRRSIGDSRVIVRAIPGGKEASPVSSTKSQAFIQLQRTIHEVCPDVAVAPFVLVGSTDSTHYADIAENIYRFIPAHISERDTQRFHGINERIALQDYLQIVHFFHRLTEKLSSAVPE